MFILSVFLIIFFIIGGTKVFYRIRYVDAFNGDEFQVHVLDVGQGDAILIKLPNNKCMMIDCGGNEKKDTVISYTKQFLKNEKLEKINYFVLTHSDEDHVGSGEAVINEIGIDVLYRPKIYCSYEIENNLDLMDYNSSEHYFYNQTIKSAYESNVEMQFNKKGIVIVENDCKIEFLSPVYDKYTKNNDYSAVIMITYKENKFLFMGDATIDIENKLIEDYGSNLKADVLKIGHHGSNSSTSESFLSYVKPKYALISVAKQNNYDLPDADVLNRLSDIGAERYSTSTNGNFAVGIKNNNIEFANDVSSFKVPLLITLMLISVLIVWNIPLNFINEADKNNNISKAYNNYCRL